MKETDIKHNMWNRLTKNLHKTILLLLLAAAFTRCGERESSTTEPLTGKTPWGFAGFVKVDSVNPILSPSAESTFNCPISRRQVQWESRNVLNPAAVVKDGRVYLFYRAQDASGTSRIGLAISDDGLHFKKEDQPVFYPGNDSLFPFEWNYRKRSEKEEALECKTCYFDGVEDPRIVIREDSTYVMTYTAYDGKTARLSSATSRDLYHWKKHGPVLRDSVYRDHWSKSGAIVSRRHGSSIVATRVNGKYWMYFGDTDIFMASSDDLIQWEPAIDEENGQLIPVLHPRKGYYDSRLVEPGPYALLTETGIVLIYNGSNSANYNDPELPEFTYAAGQALFDKGAPHRLLDRKDTYFLFPEKDYELVGEVNHVCFVEGLVFFQDKWFLYYGTGDSKIAVAVSGRLLPDRKPN